MISSSTLTISESDPRPPPWSRPAVRRALLFAILAMSCDPGGKPKAGKPKTVPADPWVVADRPAGTRRDLPAWINDPPDVLRDKITAVNAHVVVMHADEDLQEYRDLLAIVEKTPGVVAAEPFIFLEVEIASASHGPVSLAVKAVDPARVARVLPIGRHMKSGTLESLGAGQPPSIVLGDDLARTLGVGIGDRVTLTTPALSPTKWPPQAFRVTGTFHLDFDEYDERLGLAPLTAVQAMMGRGDRVTGVEATIDDIDRSIEVVAALRAKLNGPYPVKDWYELNIQLFTSLYGERRPMSRP